MSMDVEPYDIAFLVEQHINIEQENLNKYPQRSAFDLTGVTHLHSLAVKIYQAGYEEGVTAERVKFQSRNNRQKEQS